MKDMSPPLFKAWMVILGVAIYLEMLVLAYGIGLMLKESLS